MATPQTKIAVHSLPDLKNTSDDHIPLYLHTLKFRQIHTKTDVRLALGYSAVTIAAVLFAFDWKFGWATTKPYTAPAVVAYFLLNGAFTYWLWFVEKGVVYEGESKGGKLTIRTSTQKHIPVYNVTVSFTPSSHPNSPPQTIQLRAPFTRWFTSDGYFSPKPFQQWLASEIPIIGEADPDSIVEDIGRGSGQAGAVPKSGEFRVDASNAVEILEQLKKSASANQGGGNANASASGKAQGGGRRRKQ